MNSSIGWASLRSHGPLKPIPFQESLLKICMLGKPRCKSPHPSASLRSSFLSFLCQRRALLLTMSHHHGQKIVKSIDQVIQNSQEPPMSDHFATRSTMSSPLTAPPSPNSHPKSLRNDNSSDRRPKSRDRDAHQASTTNSWTTKDYIGTMRSVRESDEDSGSTMTENGLTRSRNGGTSNNNFTDFFSSEVFHIVLHNPTTAHRLLRFCQVRRYLGTLVSKIN